MRPPRLTDLDFKDSSRRRGPVQRLVTNRRKPVFIAVAVAAAGMLALAMTPGEQAAISIEETAATPSASPTHPAESTRTSLPLELPALNGEHLTALPAASNGSTEDKRVDDKPQEHHANGRADYDDGNDSGFWPVSLRLRRADEAQREVAVPRPMENGASDAGNGWAGMQAWMEPFLPFVADPSVDAIVSELAARLPPPEESFERVEVRRGDSLAAIFSRAGLSAAELHRVVNADDQAKALTRIYPGDEILFRLHDEGGLAALRYKLDNTRTLQIDRDEDGGFAVSVHEEVLETRQLQAAGTIDRSLYLSGRRAGLSNRHIMELMTIFEWQVDFNRDIRGGDAFSIIYEAEFLNGEKVRDGRILAATFINRGRRHEAVFYEDPDGNRGYYGPNGENLRKAFIRRPVQNARISSGFDRNRKHPVLGVRRPHLGTDFAAPTGTPIMASGNGRVVHVGRRGGYGHTVVIQHTNQIRTLYAHMSRYANGLRNGSRVEQGQVIGYVGATGLATGPHLHYEFKVNGAHQNPMTVNLPNGEPVSGQYIADFRSQTGNMLAQLQEMTNTQLALLSDD